MKNKKIIIISAIILISLIALFILWMFWFKKEFIIEGYKKKDNSISEIVNYNSEYKLKLPKVKYGSKVFGYKNIKNIKLKKTTNIVTNKLTNYKIIYVAKYKNKEKEFNKIIKIKDIEGPSINTNGIDEIDVCPNNLNYNLNVTSIDNLDGDLTNNLKKEIVKNQLILSIQDKHHNKSVKKLKIHYQDKEKPNINLNGNSSVSILVGQKYNDEGATATDNCDGDISQNIVASSTVDSSKAGVYKIFYSVKDSALNEEKVEREVKVLEPNQNGGIIYLTFDDGPYKYTENLLNILAKYNVKATFFVTNQYPKYRYLIKRENDEGHTVAIHTYSHNYSYVYSSVDNYFDDLNKMNAIIKEQTGHETKLVRLPGGSSNTVSRKYCMGVMSQITSELNNRGYVYFDWNLISGDSGETTKTQVVVNNVVNGMKTGKDLVVLQHDIKGFSVDAVEQIIQIGKDMGYSFQPLTASSKTFHQKVAN